MRLHYKWITVGLIVLLLILIVGAGLTIGALL